MASILDLEKSRADLVEKIAGYDRQIVATADADKKKRLFDLKSAAQDSIDTIDAEIAQIKRSGRERELAESQAKRAEQIIRQSLAARIKEADAAQMAYLRDPRIQRNVDNFQKSLENLYQVEQAAVRQNVAITPTVSQQQGQFVRGAEMAEAATTPVTATTRPTEDVAAAKPPAETTETTPDGTTPTPPAEGTTPTGTTPAAGRDGAIRTPSPAGFDEWASTQIELRGLEDNKETRTMLRAEYRKRKTFTGDWETEFRQKYPDLDYILNLDPEVRTIAQRAIEEGWAKYPQAAKAIISRLIANTQYGITSTAVQKQFDQKSVADQMDLITDKMSTLKGSYGSLGLDDSEWYKIARAAVRNGNNDNQNKALIYGTVYQKNPQTGEFAFEASVKQVEQGKLAQDVNGVFTKEYLLAKPEGDYIQQYALGEITLEDVRRQARVLAKQQFPGLSEFIDQGINVKTIADQYKSYAATILEMPSNGINMADPKFRVALDARGDGQSRALSYGEWETLLKTNPDYGWQYTKTANKQALDIATTVARAFGKVV